MEPMLECPSKDCLVKISQPFSNRWVVKLWRSVCAVACFDIPVFFALPNTLCTVELHTGFPPLPENNQYAGLHSL